jgi:hypothetical protein
MATPNGEQAVGHDSPVANMNALKDVGSEASKPKKLHGRAFYESLGSPRFVLAPMVDQSEFVLPILNPASADANLENRHGDSSHAPS